MLKLSSKINQLIWNSHILMYIIMLTCTFTKFDILNAQFFDVGILVQKLNTYYLGMTPPLKVTLHFAYFILIYIGILVSLLKILQVDFEQSNAMNAALTWEIIVYIGIAVLCHVLVYIFLTRKKVTSIVDKHVVITGGSKGIGLCLAVECAIKGANVTVIARDEKMLKGAVALMEVIRQRPNQKFQYRCLDLSSNYEDITKCLGEIEETFGDIYMLINCAGFAICGVFEDVSIKDARKLMEVNYWGTYYCTRHVLQKMKKKREGIIVVTASQAALLGIYGYGPYAASKYALRGLAETIAMESKHLGVSVTLALPSDTNTPGFENEEKTKPKETKIISSGGGLAQPEKVAKQILNDTLKGHFISVLGSESWMLTLLGGGLFRWGGVFQNFFHVLCLGPLRIIGCFLHLHFERVIKNCAKEKNE